MPRPGATVLVMERARRPWPRCVGLGLLVGLGVAGLVLTLIVLPIYAFAQATEPGLGLGRPVLRNGILHVGVPASIGSGLLSAAFVTRWYRRGGRLPTPPAQ